MLHTQSKLVAFSLLAIFSMGAHAGFYDDEPTEGDLNVPTGLYAGAGVGSSINYCTHTNEECKNTGWKLFGGYKINEMFAVEGAYYNLADDFQRLGGTTGNTVNGLPETYQVATEVTGYAAAVKAGIEMDGNLGLFGKAGLMNWRKEITPHVGAPSDAKYMEHSGTDLLVGVGAEYKVTDNIGVRGEYERVGGDLNQDLYTLGATYETY